MPLQLKLAGVTIAPNEIDAKVELYDISLVSDHERGLL